MCVNFFFYLTKKRLLSVKVFSTTHTEYNETLELFITHKIHCSYFGFSRCSNDPWTLLMLIILTSLNVVQSDLYNVAFVALFFGVTENKPNCGVLEALKFSGRSRKMREFSHTKLCYHFSVGKDNTLEVSS